MQFSEFSLTPKLLKGIAEAGYSECTRVQAETLPITLSGKDVFVQSQTGTGKTAAFLISLFEMMEKSSERERAIIITPTRELAVQIEQEAKLLGLYMDYNIISAVGGTSYNNQISALTEGVDIIIGTPGRLIDLNEKRILDLSGYNYAVIDEADRMFDMGFVGDIRKILRRLPKRNVRQTMLFSATLSYQVKRLASEFMNNPEELLISTDNITVDEIEQKLYHVGYNSKMKVLMGVLKRTKYNRCLIFLNTKHMCEEISLRLEMNGINASYLTGDLEQRTRTRRINDFKENRLSVLVATDVAARGIHIDDLELVINYDVPMHYENYVHRIGRTARAGKTGTAVTLACESYVEYLEPIEKFIKMKIPSVIAGEEDFEEDMSEGKRVRPKRSSSRPKMQQSRDSRYKQEHKNRPPARKTAEPANQDKRKQPRHEKVDPTKARLRQEGSDVHNKPAAVKRKRGLLNRFFSIFKG